MTWESVIGQHRVKDLLRKALRKKQIAHAYLFTGPDGVGKDALALAFAAALNCEQATDAACGTCPSCHRAAALQHPNIRLIVSLPVGKNEKKGDDPLEVLDAEQIKEIQEQYRTKAQNPYARISIARATSIKINSIRELRRSSSLSAFDIGRKVFIISHAEEMSAESSNALLKTLEEPSSDTVLILTAPAREQLLPTIVSRCQHVACDRIDETEIQNALVQRQGVSKEEALRLAELADGSYGRALELFHGDINREHDEVVHFVRLALSTRRVELASEIERLSAELDRDAAERWLRLLQLWLRNLLHLRERGDLHAQSGGERDDATKFIERFLDADLTAALLSVERSVALLHKNVYLPLVFTTLAIDLRQLCAREIPS